MGFSFVSGAEIIYYLGLSLLNLFWRSNSDKTKDNEDHWAAKRDEEK